MSTEPLRPRAARLVAALALLVAPAACAGTLADREAYELALEEAGAGDAGVPEAAGPTSSSGGASGGCADVPTAVFLPRCGLSGCHGDSPAAGLDLVSPDVRARLLGHPASGGPGVLVDPGGDPDASVLYLKLTPSPPFGARMPLVGATLDDATMACVAAWIAGPADGGVPAPAAPAPDAGAD